MAKGEDPRKRKDGSERTFENSKVFDNSWPCVMVLVNRWVKRDDFGGRRAAFSAHDMVPRALFLPDGRRVPVCVVAVQAAAPTSKIPTWTWPTTSFGPGYPIRVEHQGGVHTASIGCLVSDGHTTYALTSRHVCGAPGTPLYSYMGSRRIKIGVASNKQLTRLPFEDCYPDFPSRRTFVNLDVGLCQLDDLRDWKSRVYGLPQFGATAELNEANIRLRLINARVRAHGAASGLLEGRIAALFYRYKAVAGFDYVADFLIAPDGPSSTRGDSGTVWHLVPEEVDGVLMPIAVEWGGQAFASRDVADFNFALATGLASICKQLDVDVVRDNDTGARPFWGQTGHYDIAAFAVGQIRNARLKRLMTANLDRISFSIDSLDDNQIAAALKKAKDRDEFIPLADVPDLIWKRLPWQMTGGRDQQNNRDRSYGPEHPTHYADIDERLPNGQTIRQLCLADDSNISVDVWRGLYDQLGHTTSKKRGLLPFRVWQHFDEMVRAVRARKIDRFVAAAGTLSHYIGDACQPLHGSVLADGYEDQVVEDESGERTHVGAGVHSCYETKMIDRFSKEVVDGIAAQIGKLTDAFVPVNSGHGAAKATIELMERAATRIPPKKLVKTYVDAGGTNHAAERDRLWAVWGKKTILTMADGARVLAFLWEAAWKTGNGNKLAVNKLKPIELDALRDLYTDEDFLPSRDLDSIGSLLQ